MDTEKPLPTFRARRRRYFSYGQRRSVGSKDSILGSDKVEIREQLLLVTDVFDDGLDDQIGVLGSVLSAGGQSDVLESPANERLLGSLIFWMRFLCYS
jgi:hypothetical protein